MAIKVIKYVDNEGNEFDNELEADASNVRLLMAEKVEAFVEKHFPTRDGSQRGNPHAGTATRAIYLWLAENENQLSQSMIPPAREEQSCSQE